MSMMPDKLLLTCPHCGTTSSLFIRAGDVMHVSLVPEAAQYAAFQCPQCTRGVLVEWDNNLSRMGRVWPKEKANPPQYLPEDLTDFYMEAHNSLYCDAPKASLVICRSALQLTARKLGAPKGSLNSELKWLNDNGKIADQLYEVAQAIKLFGNSAAHPDPADLGTVTTEDAEQLLSFLRTFLEYVYTLPENLTKLKAKATAKP